MNPSKETRIHKLELGMQEAMNIIDTLERKIKTLEERCDKLNARILEIKE